MRLKNQILDLITELAETPILMEGPASVINNLKTRFSRLRIGQSSTVRVNSHLSRHTFDVEGDQSNFQLSFLFHNLSQRWYIESVNPYA